MVGCWAPNCSTKSDRRGDLIKWSFYPFPKESDVRRSVWIRNVNRLDVANSTALNTKLLAPPRTAKICEKHFKAEYFEMKDGKKFLTKEAIPELFPHLKRKNQPRPSPSKRRRRIEAAATRVDASLEPERQNDVIPDITPEETAGPELPEPPVAALNDSQTEERLKREIKKLKMKLRMERSAKRKAERKLEILQKSMMKIFNKDQITALKRQTRRGMTWDNSTVKKALKLRFSCGTSGYTSVLESGIPLPSVRTLQRRLQGIDYEPGILTTVFRYLKAKVSLMKEPRDKLCCLSLDEMEITSCYEYDGSSKCILGDSTMEGSVGRANHGLVFMLGGVAERWKQIVAYHFTGSSIDGTSLAKMVNEVITAASAIGLRVIAVTSDMGPSNQSMWKALHIYSRKTSLSISINNPAEPDHRVYFLADVPHLLKNLRAAFLNHREIILPNDVCTSNNLSSSKVMLSHLEDLVNFTSSGESDFALAHKLTKDTISLQGHFSKMNVSTAVHLFSREVSASLKYLVMKHNRSRDYLTTAWFLDMIDRWFTLMSSRHPVSALSTYNSESYLNAINHLQTVIKVTQTMQIGERAVWKPVQAGIVLSTTSVLTIFSDLVPVQLDFLLTSRFSQDCVENLFSLVRSKSPVPTPREFKYALKTITVAQYLKPVYSGNYDFDEREYLGDLLPTEIRPPAPSVDLDAVSDVVLGDARSVSELDKDILYYLAGYCVHSLINTSQLCESCVRSLKHFDATPHANATYLKLRNYKDNSLIEVNSDVYNLFVTWEEAVRHCEATITRSSSSEIIQRCQQSTISVPDFPSCHAVLSKLMKKFVTLRVHMICRKLTRTITSTQHLGSRSMHRKELVK